VIRAGRSIGSWIGLAGRRSSRPLGVLYQAKAIGVGVGPVEEHLSRLLRTWDHVLRKIYWTPKRVAALRRPGSRAREPAPQTSREAFDIQGLLTAGGQPCVQSGLSRGVPDEILLVAAVVRRCGRVAVKHRVAQDCPPSVTTRPMSKEAVLEDGGEIVYDRGGVDDDEGGEDG
jgi:hypothetical protein